MQIELDFKNHIDLCCIPETPSTIDHTENKAVYELTPKRLMFYKNFYPIERIRHQFEFYFLFYVLDPIEGVN